MFSLSRPFKKILPLGLAFGVLTGIALIWLWGRGVPQSWIQRQVVESYLKKVEKDLPFKVERIEFQKKNWSGLFSDRGTGLALTLKWDAWRIRLNGPLKVARIGLQQDLSIEYLPHATIEPARLKVSDRERSSALPLEIRLGLTKATGEITELGVRSGSKKWSWSVLGTEVDDFSLDASWREGQARAETSMRLFQWPDPAIRVEGFQLKANAQLVLAPFQLGPWIDFEARGKSAEALAGDLYLDLPLRTLPMQGKARLALGRKIPFDQLDLQLTSALHLKAQLEEQGGRPQTLSTQWKTTQIALQPFLKGVAHAAGSSSGSLGILSRLKELTVTDGKLRSEGKAVLHFPFEPRDFLEGKSSADGSIHISDLAMRWPELVLGFKDLNLDLPFSSRKGAKGAISAEAVAYKKLRARLKPAIFSVRPKAEKTGVSINISFEGMRKLPLEIAGLPVTIGPPNGRVFLGPVTEENPSFQFLTSVQASGLPLPKVISSLCFEQRIPPASVTIAFPSVELTPDSIDITGRVRADLFGGFVELDEMGFFDLTTDVPETDFYFKMDNIQLDQMGAWLGFGEMNGVLSGYARDVTIQGWLPTYFDLRMEAKPLRGRKKMVFSPDAMKNVIRLFADAEMDRLPGIINWMAFGWPVRTFGGYDVYYAGLSAFSSEGSILIETHDPPDIVEKQRKHFFLYGPRFKMPLESADYPLVVDAHAMGNLARRMTLILGKMSQEKALKENKDEALSQCTLDDLGR